MLGIPLDTDGQPRSRRAVLDIAAIIAGVVIAFGLHYLGGGLLSRGLNTAIRVSRARGDLLQYSAFEKLTVQATIRTLCALSFCAVTG